MPLRTFMTRAREEVKIPTVIGVRKKWIWSLTDDCEGFKTSWRKLTADVVEMAREWAILFLNLINSFVHLFTFE